MDILTVAHVFLPMAGCVVFYFFIVWYLRRVSNQFMGVKNKSGINGGKACEMILTENCINDVEVYGSISDGATDNHYNPRTKTIELEHDVYTNDSITSVAIAAHESWHAVLYSNGDFFHIIRQGLQLMVFIISGIIAIGVIGFACTRCFDINHPFLVLFQDTENVKTMFSISLLTDFFLKICCLPSEMMATGFGLNQLLALKILDFDEIKYAKKILYLSWLTYLSTFFKALAEIYIVNTIL